ncbi:GHMP kinase domain protein [Fibrisoma limi BUZ 3]|uniref:GHMP kinase domain protein n=1 Tax=Fibrisoma limi BUZ 3 TaxID=1185876 RepID=I2GF43_9BACT|nr:galactokinase family protein [Fibrisoma limi]CCH52518.1 GHMP kinase domain protein [Fibrisoma limi BUZ 3]
MAVTASTPGRICLFGEHLDYLGLPVIAAAISRRITLTTERIQEPVIRLHLPDIGADEQFGFTGQPLPYQQDRDYYRAALNILLREGYTFSSGFDVTVKGDIPINSGTSSSSALVVTWLNALSRLADNPQPLSPERLAELAYVAEVLEFGEPGGMMDHYSTAVGNVIYLESQPQINLTVLRPHLGTFVLGDSQEPKDTLGILGRVKFGMLDMLKRINGVNPAFSLHTASLTDAAEYKDILTKDEYILLKGTLTNRDVLREALTVLQAPELDHTHLGKLLTTHQATLRDAQRISTPKIDRMLDAALNAGAMGGKINGSGGGGCMFVYAPDQPEAVAEAIEREGGKAYVIHVAQGAVVE